MQHLPLEALEAFDRRHVYRLVGAGADRHGVEDASLHLMARGVRRGHREAPRATGEAHHRGLELDVPPKGIECNV